MCLLSLQLMLRPGLKFESCFENVKQIRSYTYFQWTEDRQGFQIQYLTLDT